MKRDKALIRLSGFGILVTAFACGWLIGLQDWTNAIITGLAAIMFTVQFVLYTKMFGKDGTEGWK